MSTETPVKPIITKHSSEFKLDAYASTPTMELVIFAVQVLQADGVPVAVEEVVSTCFRFFPHSFALKNYFYWPDSALVGRRLHDAKEKGLLKGSASEGFELKGKGKQVAKQVAKGLGVALPEPPKVEVPVAPVVEEKKEETKQEEPRVTSQAQPTVKKAALRVEKKETKKRVTKKKQPPVKKVEPKVVEKKETKKRVTSGKKAQPPVKKAEPKVEKKETKKRVTNKKKVQPPVKKAKPNVVEKLVTRKQATSDKKKTLPVAKPEVKKAEPKVEKKKETKAKPQPTQLTMPLTPATVWKKVEGSTAKPKVQKEAPKVKVEVLTPVAASKEEKDKAAKVIKQVERSDAYQLYRRNGRRAQIGEFDFRNMLFATMESSPETLKRNLDLFKRYAGIHFRADLITFFEFCEETFKSLLVAKVKGKK